MTDGGADYCFECVGKTSIVEEAYASSRKVSFDNLSISSSGNKRLVLDIHIVLVGQGWGKTVVLGVDKPGAKLTLSSYDVLHHGKTLSGSLFGGLKPKSDIPILIKKYIDKVVLHQHSSKGQSSKSHLSRVFNSFFNSLKIILKCWCRNWNWTSL